MQAKVLPPRLRIWPKQADMQHGIEGSAKQRYYSLLATSRIPRRESAAVRYQKPTVLLRKFFSEE